MTMRLGFVIFPGLTQLDLTSAWEVLSRLPNSTTLLIGATKEPVAADTGLRFMPDATFDEVESLDLVCVPGGPGATDACEDQAVLAFLRRVAPQAQWVTSVCTGALVLGAAGLLDGYRATTHWASLDLLPYFGATVVKERWVIDRNRATGGGVTAGIDFGLALAERIAGREVAELIQLNLEYRPAPPLQAGGPELVPVLAEKYLAGRGEMAERRRAIAQRYARGGQGQ